MPQIAYFIDQVPVDGLWIDMNEPSNFCDGACGNATSEENIRRVSPNFDPVHPPYTIGNRRGVGSTTSSPLNQKTLDMDAKHHSGATAYNMHNLYGKLYKWDGKFMLGLLGKHWLTLCIRSC